MHCVFWFEAVVPNSCLEAARLICCIKISDVGGIFLIARFCLVNNTCLQSLMFRRFYIWSKSRITMQQIITGSCTEPMPYTIHLTKWHPYLPSCFLATAIKYGTCVTTNKFLQIFGESLAQISWIGINFLYFPQAYSIRSSSISCICVNSDIEITTTSESTVHIRMRVRSLSIASLTWRSSRSSASSCEAAEMLETSIVVDFRRMCTRRHVFPDTCLPPFS